jgi:hypothetical protein
MEMNYPFAENATPQSPYACLVERILSLVVFDQLYCLVR